MPREKSPGDMPQGRKQLHKELEQLRTRVRELEAEQRDSAASGSSPPSFVPLPHPPAYPLGDPAFPYQPMIEELSEVLVALSPHPRHPLRQRSAHRTEHDRRRRAPRPGRDFDPPVARQGENVIPALLEDITFIAVAKKSGPPLVA